MIKIILLLIFMLASSISFAEVSSLSSLIASIQNRDQKNVSISLDRISSEFEELIVSDITEFSVEMEIVRKTLERDLNPEEHYFWYKRIEERVIERYIGKTLEFISYIDPAYIQSFYDILETGIGKIKILNSYHLNGSSHGKVNIQSRTMSLKILPFDEFIPIVVHELTHYLDHDLVTFRTNMTLLRRESENDDIKFGQYWFLRSTYLSHYSEVLPQIRACEVYSQLILDGKIGRELGNSYFRYKDVIDGEISCEELIKKEVAHKERPNLFWDKGTEEYERVKAYERVWHEKHGLTYPFYEN